MNVLLIVVYSITPFRGHMRLIYLNKAVESGVKYIAFDAICNGKSDFQFNDYEEIL